MRAGSRGDPGLEEASESAFPAGRWAIFPSSFNPPTLAHIEMLRWALEQGGFTRVLLLLDIHHADKEIHDAILEDRAFMMRVAFSRDSRLTLVVSSHGRFLDKLEALDRLRSDPQSWTFLVGGDTFVRTLDPRFYEDPEGELGTLFSGAGFMVFREGSEAGSVRRS